MQALNSADWLIVIVVFASMLISILRGFVKEALSLLSWVLALVLALVFSERLALLLSDYIADSRGRYLLAFAILFIGTLVVGALLGKLMRSVVEMAGLSLLDRLLGMIFGAARGIMLLLAVAAMMRTTLQLDASQWWQESVLLPHLLMLESWFRAAAGSVQTLIAGLWA